MITAGTLSTGAALSVVGNFCISLGFQLQRIARNLHFTSTTQSLMKMLGIALMVFGECSNFAACGMAPISLVAPMDAVAILSNILLFRLISKEKLSRSGVMGVFMITLGIASTALNFPQMTADPSESYGLILSQNSLIFICVTGVAALLVANPLDFAIGISLRRKCNHAIYYCFLSGSMAMLTVISAKGISTAILQSVTLGRYSMFNNPETCWLTYLLFITLVTSTTIQMRYLHIAFDLFGSGLIMSLYYMIFSLLSVSAGMVVFEETSFVPDTYAGLYATGLMLMFAGVCIVSRDDRDSQVFTNFNQHVVVVVKE
jgi:hypothetical protein